MLREAKDSGGQCHGKWLFLTAFAVACFLFWWLPSVLYRGVVQFADPVDDGTILISVVAFLLFAAGYLLPRQRTRRARLPDSLLNACAEFAYTGTIVGAIPALAFAIEFWRTRSGVDYGTGDGIPGLYQAVLYTHMFLGFLYIGAASPEGTGRRRIIWLCFLVALPRLIVSLHWGRFFLVQAVIPMVLIAVARGWIRFSLVRALQLALIGFALIFIPALTRGDDLSGSHELVQFIASGSTLRLYQDNADLNLSGRCPPLLVSLAAKVVPYRVLGICTIDLWGMTNLPATLDRLLAYEEPGSDIQLVGPGSNYLLELSLTGGLPAVFIGSAVFGLACRFCLASIGTRSLLAGVWAECLTRALLAPRSNLGYVFERVPTLMLATLCVVALVTAARLLEVNRAQAQRARSNLEGAR